jgi:HTH-type transcriptional regulator / antitoxin MqsA
MTEYCPICDSRADLFRETRVLKFGRRETAVEHELYRCPNCAEEWYTPEQMALSQSRAAAAIRQEDRLLEPEEIRSIREGLELSQADFERLLCFGPKTVGRWERGTVFPNKSSDMLLRVVREFPEVVRFLAHQNGVELPVDGSWQGGPTKSLTEAGMFEATVYRSARAVPSDLNQVFRPGPEGFAPVLLQVTAEEMSGVT